MPPNTKQYKSYIKKFRNSSVFFEIKPEHDKHYIEVLTRYYTEIDKKDCPRDFAERVYRNLRNGMTMAGKRWTTGSNSFDKRVEFVTKGFYTGTKETSIYKAQPVLDDKTYEKLVTQENYIKSTSPNLPESYPNRKITDYASLLRFFSEEERKDYEDKYNTLLREYPDLDKNVIREEVRTYCILDTKIKSLISSNLIGSETGIKNLIDSKIKLGEFLGLSERLRIEENVKYKKDNIASLVLQFEKTIKEFPEYTELLRLREFKILLEKYDRGELPRWLAEHTSHLGMEIEAARKIVEENKHKIV